MTDNSTVYSVLVCELIVRVKDQYPATIVLSDAFSSSWLELYSTPMILKDSPLNPYFGYACSLMAFKRSV